jgi:5,10-methenyltetrahydrofolate synthetase
MQEPSFATPKEELRKRLLAEMRLVALDQRSGSAAEVMDQWRGLHFPTGWVVSFHSLPEEPDLAPLNRLLFEQGRLAWVDWTADRPRFVKAVEPTRSTDWRVSPRGEPLPDHLAGLILVPAVAFTVLGDRLGRGAGAYDRLLGCYPDMDTVGIGWKELECPDLPTDPWDRRVRRVILIG